MLPAVESGFARVLQGLCELGDRVKNQQIFCFKKQKQQAPPARGAGTAEATPDRAVRGGQGEARAANSTPHLRLARFDGSKPGVKTIFEARTRHLMGHHTYVYRGWHGVGYAVKNANHCVSWTTRVHTFFSFLFGGRRNWRSG